MITPRACMPKYSFSDWNHKSGTVEVCWSPDDYIHSDWEHVVSLNGLAASSEILEIYGALVGVMIPRKVEPKFHDLCAAFDLDDMVLDLSMYRPGMMLPWHHDTYRTYMSRRGMSDASDIVRIIIFLHDPAPGHQLWIGDHLCTGGAGSWFSWQAHQSHMAANLGQQDRYVVQITGRMPVQSKAIA